MIFQLAKITLQLYILKQVARSPVRNKLIILRQCHFLYGAMIPLMVISALATLFFAMGAVFPSLFDLVRIGQPTPDGISNTFAFFALLLAATFFILMFFMLFKMREILASYWLLIFSTHFVQHKPAPLLHD